jgi:transcriptional regulator with XRE-family HTH domain
MSNLKHEKQRLEAYIESLRQSGQGIPVSKQRPNNAATAEIARATGIKQFRLADDKYGLRPTLTLAIKELGLASGPVKYIRPSAASLSFMKDMTVKYYKQLAKDRGVLPSNDLECVDRLFEVLLIEGEGDWEADGLAALQLMKGMSLSQDLMKYKNKVDELVKKYCDPNALPDSFARCLDVAIDRSKFVSRTAFATALGLNQGTVNNWCNGSKSPDISVLPKISEMETELELEPGTLSNRWQSGRIAVGQVSHKYFPVKYQAPEHAQLRIGVSEAIRPDFFELSADRQNEEMKCAIATYVRNLENRRSHYDRRQSQYKLPLDQWPLSAQEEFAALVAYKRGEVSKPNFSKIDQYAESNWHSENTVKRVQAHVENIYGFVAGYAPELCRLDNEDLCLAVLTCATVHRHHFEFRAQRAAEYGDPSELTPTDLDILTFVKSWLNVKDGFFCLDQDALNQIQYLEHKLKIVQPEHSKTEWGAITSFGAKIEFCYRAFEELDNLEKHLRPRTRSHKNALRDRIEDVLMLDRPVVPLLLGLERFQDQLSTTTNTGKDWRGGIRHLVYAHLMLQLPLRAHTWVKLEYHEDGSGEIFRKGAEWWFKIPHVKLKNGRTTNRAREEDCLSYRIQNFGGLYKLLETYVYDVRPLILGGTKSDFFCVSSKMNPGYSEAYFEKAFADFISRIIRKFADQGAFGSVASLTPQAMRALIATSILKSKDGSIELAADALYDAPDTVKRHYLRFVSLDRARELRAVMATILNQRLDDGSAEDEGSSSC